MAILPENQPNLPHKSTGAPSIRPYRYRVPGVMAQRNHPPVKHALPMSLNPNDKPLNASGCSVEQYPPSLGWSPA